MADSVDDRIVAMKFDNATFEAKIGETLKSLEKLQSSLDLTNAAKGLQNLNVGDANEKLGHMADAVETIRSKFSAMGIAGIAAITNITNRIIDSGINFAKSFAFGPIQQGFSEMETKVGSIQTILANTAKFGTTLPQVTASLNELNDYSDKTIYNFGQMTKNIGLFTNAGIRMEDATSMIKGFSNAAAASGTTAEGAAGAAYQLSQALSNGTVRLMDWRSLTNVGMGNKNMQSALVDIAGKMGTLNEAGVEAADVQAHFNETLETGWLTTDVMSTYLKIMAGDMTDAQIAALGFSDAQVQAFRTQQKTAEEAATKVRTFTQLVNTVRESIGSGWAQTIEIILGDFEGASSLLTAVNNAISGFVGRISDARNAMLKTWADMNGRGTLIEGIVRIFQSLMMVVNGVKFAFRNLFPAQTGADLLRWTASFSDFSFALKDFVDRILPSLTYGFGVVFSVIRIGVNIVKGITGLFSDLFKALVPERGGTQTIKMFGGLARVLYTLNVTLINEGITKFFEYLGKVLVPIAKLIGRVIGAIFDLVGAFDFSKIFNPVLGFFKSFGNSISFFIALLDRGTAPLTAFAGAFSSMFGKNEHLVGIFNSIVGAMSAVVSAVKEFSYSFRTGFSVDEGTRIEEFAVGLRNSLLKVRDAIAKVIDFIRDIDFGGILSGIGSGFGKLKDILVDFFSFGGDTDKLDKAKQSVKEFADEYKQMYQDVNAKALGGDKLNLAAFTDDSGKSVGRIKEFFLRIQDYFISFRDTISGYLDNFDGIGKRFNRTITKFFTGSEIVSDQSAFENLVSVIDTILISGILLTVNRFINQFAGLVKEAKGVFKELGGALGRFGKEAKSTTLIKIAIAIGLIAGALKVLADIPREDLLGALGAMSASFLLLFGMLKAMDKFIKNSKNIKETAVTLIALGIGMKFLADAIKTLSTLSWDELKHGLAGVGGGLVALGVALKLMGGGVSPGTALVLLGMAGAMFILGLAIEKFAKYSWTELAKGIISMSIAIVAIGFAVGQMGPSSILAAPAIFIVALALGKLADVAEKFGKIPFKQLAQGLEAMVVLMLALILPLKVLGPESVLAAAAMAIVAFTFDKFVGVVEKLGKMKFKELAQGLEAMVVILIAVAAAANAMNGAALGAAGLVAVSFAIGLLVEAIIKLGSADIKAIGIGIGVLVVSFLLLAAAGAFLSPFLLALGIALAALGLGFLLFGAGVAVVVRAFVYLADAANENTRKVLGVLEELAKELPRILAVFIKHLALAAKDIAKSSNEIAKAFAQIVIGFLDAIILVVPKIRQTVDTITTSILGFIGDRIVDFVAMGFKILLALGDGILNNVGELTQKGVTIIAEFMTTLANEAPKLIDAGVRLLLALIYGFGSRMQEIVNAGGNLIIYFMAGIASKTLDVIKSAGAILIAFMDGLAAWIRDNAQTIHESGVNLATAIVEGIVVGLVGEKNMKRVIDGIKNLAGLLPDWARKVLGIESPSKVFMKIGGHVGEGLALGLDRDTMAKNSAVRSAERIVEAFSQTLSNIHESVGGMDELNPVITPVLDLTKVQIGARGISGLMEASISPSVSFDQATQIAASSEQNNTPTDTSVTDGPKQVTFVQNNYSPKALSTNDIYRNQKSQFALAKEELNI